MALIPDETIEQILDRVDIVELASRYMTLKRAGVNNMGCCPFHNEKTPSFNVNASRQRYHCFGCGVDGHAISLLMHFEGLGFRDACKRLAAEVGITIEERPESPQDEQRRRQRERLLTINELAAAWFHQNLMDLPVGESARNYMRQRGYGRKAAAEYQIGFAPDSWDGLTSYLAEKGCNEDDVRVLGLIRPGKQNRGDYDLFRGRLMFPIYDVSGQVVAFAGRVLDSGKPKYINSPESPVYHKGRVLFGLYQARQAMRKSDEAILVEGYFDQLALYRAGFPQVVATCGTALTADHARLLKRYAKRVVLLFDQDEAGKQATFKAMRVLQEESVPAVVIALPAGEDPDSFLHKSGPDAFSQRLAEARPVMDVFIDDCLGGAETVEEKAAAAERVLEHIHALNSPLEKDLYFKELARRSDIDLEILKSKQPQTRRPIASVEPPPPLPPEEFAEPLEAVAQRASAQSYAKPSAQQTLSRSEETLLRLLACSREARRRLADMEIQELPLHPDARALASALTEYPDDDIGSQDPPAALTEEQKQYWLRLVAADALEFGDNIGQAMEDCLWKLKEGQLRRQVNELQMILIPEAEQSGDRAKADQYRYELSELQQKIRNRCR